MRFSLLLIFSVFTVNTFSQSNTSLQVSVFDAISNIPLEGCEIEVFPKSEKTNTDSLGSATFHSLLPGRYYVMVTKEGYKLFVSDNFLHTNQKSSQMILFLQDGSVNLKEIEVKTASMLTSNESKNSFSYLSNRSFSSEDTERIPMGLNDPARMSLSYTGVHVGRSDLDNPIIVRGNSPYGVSWRIEGIDVPNPNHFAKHGTSGGGLSILSAQVIGNSDFYSGAMPAEFGNALAATFDIKLREGNYSKKAYKARASMLGIDVAAEGPFKNNRSSFLINYRYSTLGLMNWLTFYLVGNRTVNTFSDLSFNLIFNSKNLKNKTTVFGVFGKSMDHAFPQPEPEKRKVGVLDDWEERIRPSDMGVLGITHTRNINSRSSLKIVAAATLSRILRYSDTLSFEDVHFRYNTEKYIDNRLSTNVAYLNKLSNTLKLKTGVQIQLMDFEFNRTTLPRSSMNDVTAQTNGKLIWANGNGSSTVAEAYAMLEKVWLEKIYLNAGFHNMHFFFNNTNSFEPRIALKYSPNVRHIVAASYGLHSQLLPMSTYFVARKANDKAPFQYDYPNQNLAFPRSEHIVLSYRTMLAKDFKLTTELYSQNISRSLVQETKESSFWILNASDGYPGITNMVATGKGFNKGVDITVEKLFYSKYFLMFTGSLYDAKFQTYAGDIFNSSFNDRFGSTLTFGREFNLRKSRVIQAGFRGMFNGGFHYTEPDLVKSTALKTYIPKFTETNKLNAPAYKRLDARIAYRYNGKRTSGQIALDIQNATGYANVSRAFYNISTRQIELQRKGTGFTPIASVAVEF